MRKWRYIFILLLMIFVLSSTKSEADIIRVTNNDDWDVSPSLYNKTILWNSIESIGNGAYVRNIDYWDGNTINRITNNQDTNLEYKFPSLFDSKATWMQLNESGYSQGDIVSAQINYWDGSNISKLADVYYPFGSYDRVRPTYYDGQVAYSSYDGEDFEIYLSDGTTTRQITDNDSSDTIPSLYDGTIAWSGSGGLNYWDGEDITVVSTPGGVRDLYLFDGSVAYTATDLDSSRPRAQIFLWDGTTIEQITEDATFDTGYPALDNSGISFQFATGDDNVSNIGYWNSDGLHTLFTCLPHPGRSSLYAGTAAFSAPLSGIVGDEIYFWDGDPNDLGVYPPGTGGNGGTGAPVPEPSTMLLLGFGLSGLGFLRRKKK